MKRMFVLFWKQEKSLKYTRTIHHIQAVSFWDGWKVDRYMLLQQITSLIMKQLLLPFTNLSKTNGALILKGESHEMRHLQTR